MRNIGLICAALLLAAIAAPVAAQYDGYGAAGGNRVRCDSNDNRTRVCAVDVRGGVRLLRQVSGAPCIEGHTWGADRRGIWVANGCRGEFQVGYGGDAWDGNSGWNGDGRGDIVRCDSNDNRTRVCAADVRGGVRLLRQVSNSPCIEGRTWGADRRGIWVANGCRAEFQVGYGGNGRGNHGWGGGDGRGDVVRCDSNDNRKRYCNADVRAGVWLQRQLSRSPCIEGRSWGYDRRGIWVANGCRAEFQVGGRGGYGYGR